MTAVNHWCDGRSQLRLRLKRSYHLSMRSTSAVRLRSAVFRSVLATTLILAGTAAMAADFSLVEAARNQDQQKVRASVTQRAYVNVRSADGSTALLWAAHWNDLATAELLLRAAADPNAADDCKRERVSQPVHDVQPSRS